MNGTLDKTLNEVLYKTNIAELPGTLRSWSFAVDAAGCLRGSTIVSTSAYSTRTQHPPEQKMAPNENGTADDQQTKQPAEVKLPDWLNEAFFEEIFVSQHSLAPGKFKVKINRIIPTGGAGENYTSSLYRANVDAVCDGKCYLSSDLSWSS